MWSLLSRQLAHPPSQIFQNILHLAFAVWTLPRLYLIHPLTIWPKFIFFNLVKLQQSYVIVLFHCISKYWDLYRDQYHIDQGWVQLLFVNYNYNCNYNCNCNYNFTLLIALLGDPDHRVWGPRLQGSRPRTTGFGGGGPEYWAPGLQQPPGLLT